MALWASVLWKCWSHEPRIVQNCVGARVASNSSNQDLCRSGFCWVLWRIRAGLAPIGKTVSLFFWYKSCRISLLRLLQTYKLFLTWKWQAPGLGLWSATSVPKNASAVWQYFTLLPLANEKLWRIPLASWALNGQSHVLNSVCWLCFVHPKSEHVGIICFDFANCSFKLLAFIGDECSKCATASCTWVSHRLQVSLPGNQHIEQVLQSCQTGTPCTTSCALPTSISKSRGKPMPQNHESMPGLELFQEVCVWVCVYILYICIYYALVLSSLLLMSTGIEQQ